MSNSSIRRFFCILLLVLAVTAPRALAASPLTAGPRSQEVAAADPFKLIGRLWGFFTNLWSKEGCMMDPNGRCTGQAVAPPAPPEKVDTGCRMDPSGRCKGD